MSEEDYNGKPMAKRPLLEDDDLKAIEEVERFTEKVREDPCGYDMGYWNSEEGKDIKWGGACSRAEYERHRNKLDPTLGSMAVKAKAWCCIYDCRWRKHSWRCIRFKCGVPERFTYFCLTMFIVAISFMLEIDFMAMMYFVFFEGSLNSNDALERIMSYYSLLSWSVVYFALAMTIDQCTKFYCPSCCHKGMKKDESRGAESFVACKCPVMIIGSADEDGVFPDAAARTQNIRLRWWMLVPFSRMLFIPVITGNVDFQLASKKTVEKIRTEKLMAIKGVTLIGIVNTLTLTGPNIGIAMKRFLSGRTGDLDTVFLFCSMMSLVLTIISMCYGVLDAAVNFIDQKDKILTDLTLANLQQRQVAEFGNLHLNKLKVIAFQGYEVLNKCEWVENDREADRREYSTWSSYQSALNDFIPEDHMMCQRKQKIIRLLEEINKLTDKEQMDENLYKRLVRLLKEQTMKFDGLLSYHIDRYSQDYKVACVITNTELPEVYNNRVDSVEKGELDAMRSMFRYRRSESRV